MKVDHASAVPRTLTAWFALLAFVVLSLPASAATAYKCTGRDGRATFSDQPCPDTEQTSEVKLRGQPLIGGKDGDAKPPAEDEGQGEDAEETETQSPKQEEVEDVRAPRLRRLDALLNQLFSTLNAAGEDCNKATGAIDGWIKRNGSETRELYAAWDEVRYEKLNLKQKELEALRSRMQRQVSQLKSVTLPKLNAKCWNDRALGAAFDRLQPYLPGS